MWDIRLPWRFISDEHDSPIVSFQASSGYASPNDECDPFMKVDPAVGAQLILAVNYGSNFAGPGGGEVDGAGPQRERRC